MSVTGWPDEVNVNGEAGDAVTPLGSPDRLIVTSPEKPFWGLRARLTWTLEPGFTDTDGGLAAIEKLGGGPDPPLLPPPQPENKRAKNTLMIAVTFRGNIVR